MPVVPHAPARHPRAGNGRSDLAVAAGQVLVYLPLSGGVPEAPAEPAPPAPPPAPVLETVLIVEDEPGIRALMRKILQKHGYTVLEAGSEEEALRQVREQRGPIHLLITDVMLRQSTGKKVAEQVTALNTWMVRIPRLVATTIDTTTRERGQAIFASPTAG